MSYACLVTCPPTWSDAPRDHSPYPTACPPGQRGGYEHPASALARSLGRALLALYYGGNHSRLPTSSKGQEGSQHYGAADPGAGERLGSTSRINHDG